MTDNKNDVLFGTSVFGGFNRRDVIEYIDKLQRSAQGTEDEIGLSDTKQNLRTAQVRVQTLEKDLTALQEENAALRAELEICKKSAKEAEKLQAEIAQLQKDLAALQTANGEAENACTGEEFFEAVEESE